MIKNLVPLQLIKEVYKWANFNFVFHMDIDTTTVEILTIDLLGFLFLFHSFWTPL